MRFEIKHTFDCAPETLWEITSDPAFEARVAVAADSTRQIVSDETTGGVTTRRVRITVNRDLPPAMKKAIGADAIGYDQITTRPEGGNELTWRIEPDVLKGRFKGEGKTRVRAAGDGCERIIAGELAIRVPLIGAKMEKRLVEDVKQSYERAAGVIREMLAERGA